MPQTVEPRPAEPVVVSVPFDRLERDPLNPRPPASKDTRLEELVESIRVHGQKQPCVVRPAALAEGRYRLVIGHRRAAACAELGREVLCIREDLDDDAALAIMLSDNEVRTDVDPFLEAKAVGALLGRANWTLQAVAEALGKSPRWVAQRANLLHLAPAVRKVLAGDPKVHRHPDQERLSRWPVAWLERLATLPPAAQESVARRPWVDDLESLEEAVGEFTRQLGAAPWDLEDELLLPQAGACAKCPRQSGRQPGLFDDGRQVTPVKKSTCLDSDCWGKKVEAHGKARLAELRAEHEDLVAVEGAHDSDRPELRVALATPGLKVIPHWRTTPAQKGDRGAVPALVAKGKGKGTLVWVKVKKAPVPTAQARGAKKEKPLTPKAAAAAARAEVRARREAWVGEQVEDVLGKMPAPSGPGSLGRLIPLAAIYGVQPVYNMGKGTFRRLLKEAGSTPVVSDEARAVLWDGLRDALLDDPSYWEQDLELVAQALEVDVAALEDLAKLKIPDPAAVKALPRGKPKKLGKVVVKLPAKPSRKPVRRLDASKPAPDLEGAADAMEEEPEVCRSCGCTPEVQCSAGCSWARGHESGKLTGFCTGCSRRTFGKMVPFKGKHPHGEEACSAVDEVTGRPCLFATKHPGDHRLLLTAGEENVFAARGDLGWFGDVDAPRPKEAAYPPIPHPHGSDGCPAVNPPTGRPCRFKKGHPGRCRVLLTDEEADAWAARGELGWFGNDRKASGKAVAP